MFTPTWPRESDLDRLESQMSVLRRGCDYDGVSEFVRCLKGTRDEARDALATIWWRKCNLSDCPPHLRAHEVSQRAKLGSTTLRDPSSVKPKKGPSLQWQFERPWRPYNTSINSKSAKYADEQIRRWIRGGSLQSVSTLDAAVSFDGSSSKGWPWFMTTRRVPLCYLNEAEALVADGLRLKHATLYPNVGSTRGQSQGPGLYASWRAISGGSMVTNLLKKRVYIPTRDRLLRRHNFCAKISREAVDHAVTKILKSARGRQILSIDFSKFDASIPNEVLDRMFQTLRHWFQASDRQLVRFCQEAFQRAGLYTPAGYFPGGERGGGVPSGSVLTNLIDSMVNFWVVTYAAHRLGAVVEDYLLEGDDGVYLFRGEIDYGALSDVLLVELGMIMSPSKCLISDREVLYLQSTHSIDHQSTDGVCYGIRPINRFLHGFCKEFPQGNDEVWGPVLGAVRSLQQFNNCSGHPSFEQGWRWLWTHDFENIHEAIVRLCNNDPTLLERCDKVRAMRAGGISTRVMEMYDSPVVVALVNAFPRCFKVR